MDHREPLAGLSFAAKANMDVRGELTTNGSPAWADSHPPAVEDARCVEIARQAGASLTSIAECVEMCFSLDGDNPHFGTPPNPLNPGRLPGGSSSGSASEVAAGAVDFALGTDTSGSVRIPASYCGTYGARPSHGRIPLTGVAPLSPQFDTVGWMTRVPETFGRVGRVLLDGAAASTSSDCLRPVVLEAAAGHVEPAVWTSLESWIENLADRGVRVDRFDPGWDLGELAETLRSIQAHDIHRALGPWLDGNEHRLSPAMAYRLRWHERVPSSQLATAERARTALRQAYDSLPAGTVFVFPSAPGAAPSLESTDEERARRRDQAVALNSIACLVGAPHFTVPALSHDGASVGVSLLGPVDSDLAMLSLIERDFAVSDS